MKVLRQILSEAADLLELNGIDNAKIDAWLLLEHVCQISKVDYYKDPNMTVSLEKANEYMDLVKRRSSRIPVQHIIGTQEFMGLFFKVNENVLIPRQETEILVERVIQIVKKEGYSSVLDMCTGSGCIITSVAKNTHLKRAVAVDLSQKALELAKENAILNQCHNITWIQSNLFDEVTGTYDVIVSNPPYIPTKDLEELQAEVKLHEPRLALDGYEDGLFFYREITKKAKKFLRLHGYLFYEIGYNQGSDVKNLMIEEGFDEIQVVKDYTGLDRIVIGKLGGEVNV